MRMIRCALIFALIVSAATSSSAVEVADKEERLLSAFNVPLYSKSGGVELGMVPALVYGPPPGVFLRALCSPVYATTADESLRDHDLNLVSLMNIKLTTIPAVPKNREERIELVVDLSGFRRPAHVKAHVSEVIEATLLCVRMLFPPALPQSRMEVRIIGSENPELLKRFNGPLWLKVADP